MTIKKKKEKKKQLIYKLAVLYIKNILFEKSLQIGFKDYLQNLKVPRLILL